MANYQFPYSQKELAIKVNSILSEYSVPLTVRQIYYRLVALGLMNQQKVYKNLCDKLSRLRESGDIPWDKIIDLRRQPEVRNQWENVEDFYDWVKSAYSRNLQQSQPKHLEIWCEKAVSIQDIADKYGIAVLAGGGYRSSSALYETAKRYKHMGKPIVVLYLGDFDPSGLDIERDIEARMVKVFGVKVDVQRVLLNYADIANYKLLPSPVKLTDRRTPNYSAKYGNNVYELDALLPDVLSQKLETAIINNLDMSTYTNELKQEDTDVDKIENELDV